MRTNLRKALHPDLCLVALALVLGCLSCGVCTPKPIITSISPSNTLAGGPAFPLTVNGSHFRPDSLVSWNAVFRLTTFISNHQLVTNISSVDIATPGTISVFVFNPPESGTVLISGAIAGNASTLCSGKNSNVFSFTVKP